MSDALSKVEGIHTEKPSWKELEDRYETARTASLDASESYAAATVDFLRQIAAALRDAKTLVDAQSVALVIEQAVATCVATEEGKES